MKKAKQSNRRRKGAIIVLTAVMMAMVLGMMAFSVDLGYLTVVRTQLQSSADAAALAAAGDLFNSRINGMDQYPTTMLHSAKAAARYYAASNEAGGVACQLADADIVLGRLNLALSGTATIVPCDPSKINAVQIRVRRTAEMNGEISLFFANVFGVRSGSSEATATAVFSDSVRGFRPPTSGKTLPVLPFALDKQTWDAMNRGYATDLWTWNEGQQRVTWGPDGKLEMNLYPQGTGAPGNRGTVDIGNPNNSTKDLVRQILDGVTSEDLSYLPNGKLELGSDGSISLNGDTGMSAGIKDEMTAIIGRTGVIPIFDSVANQGNKAQFHIVKFVGVRVMAVDMTGKATHRYIMVQPAKVNVEGGIIGNDDAETSEYVYSKNIWLVK